MIKSKHFSQHSLYQKNLISSLKLLYKYHKDRIEEYSCLIDKLFYLNLDSAYEVLSPLYSNTGRPAMYQAEILRSLIAMGHLRIHSITNWIKKLKTDRVLATICGFDPDNIPGIGTFYDFMNRVCPSDGEPGKIRSPHQKPGKNLKKGEKLPPKHPSVVKALVDRILNGRAFWGSYKVLSTLFSKIAVEPSIKMGLIENVSIISGDGAPVESCSKTYGKKLCDCSKNGIKHCNCKRKFSDPSARWGWDSYHERYFFGYSLYVITAFNGKYDLPVHFILPQGNRHDSVSAVVALAQLKTLYPKPLFSYFVSDSACDNFATYELCKSYNLRPFIDLNHKNTPADGIVKFNDNGIPICPLGLTMSHWGYNKDRYRIKWRCPVSASKKKKEKFGECPMRDACSSSSYGRVVYTYPESNPRLFTTPPRGFNSWRDLYYW